MKRTIYLMRHGEIQEDGEPRRCIGHTDLPLTREGEKQALRLREYFDSRPVTAVYSSPLIRCLQTAQIAFPDHEIRICEGLVEQFCGEWEGLDFTEIKERDPAYYAARGHDLAAHPPKGGETLSSCLERMKEAVLKIASESTGDIAIIAHSTVNRTLIAWLLDIPLEELQSVPQPPSCINKLVVKGETLILRSIGQVPHAVPSDEEIMALWDRFDLPAHIRAHTSAVANVSAKLARALEETDPVDIDLLRAAAKLHDIARLRPHHAHVGCEWIREAGYPLVAEIVETHDAIIKPVGRWSAALLLNMADKYGSETEIVSLQVRFERSRQKCTTREAVQALEDRYDAALRMEKQWQEKTGIDEDVAVWLQKRRNG